MLSLGMLTLATIWEEKAIYVDKMELAWKLFDKGSETILFTRPRHFGKSLFLDTLKKMLQHNATLLADTFITHEHKFEKIPNIPILHLDFNIGNKDPIMEFNAVLKRIADQGGFGPKYEELLLSRMTLEPNCKLHLDLLLDAISLTSQVAILVNEYDFPFAKNDRTVDDFFYYFFVQVKKLIQKERIDFTFITGSNEVIMYRTRFGLASTLGFLDISFDPNFLTICGFTLKEIEDNYGHLIKDKEDVFKKSMDEIYEQMKIRYDGCLFSNDG